MKPPVLMIGNFLSASGGTLCVCEELSHKLSGLKACNETKWHDALEKLTRDPKLCAAIGQGWSAALHRGVFDSALVADVTRYPGEDS